MKEMVKFKVADLVRWYEYYEDHIVRDAGLGVILNLQEFPNFLGEGTSLTSYRVFKFKTQDCEWFTHHEMEPVNAMQINPSVTES